MKITPFSVGWRGLLLLLAASTAAAQTSSQTPADQPTTPSVTVTGKVPTTERPLPKLSEDAFSNCMNEIGPGSDVRNLGEFYSQSAICEHRLNMERHTVIERCINEKNKSEPRAVVQACTESLDHKILQGTAQYYIFVNRAEAYLAQGDTQHALEDYNAALQLAPRNASLYYNRGVYYGSQSDTGAALRDFDAALGIDPKFVPALRQRARVHGSKGDFSGAIADYSEAIRLEPKTAALWSERGYLSLQLKDYQSALKDEAEAIRLDPKFARAYFLHGAAYGDLGDSRNAVAELVKAVDLDPSLDRFVTTKGKTASITLPPW